MQTGRWVPAWKGPPFALQVAFNFAVLSIALTLVLSRPWGHTVERIISKRQPGKAAGFSMAGLTRVSFKVSASKIIAAFGARTS